MDPSNNQPSQPPQAPNPNQQPTVITPQQQGVGTMGTTPQQMPGMPAGPTPGSTTPPVYPQQNWPQSQQPSMQPQGVMPSSGGSKKKILLVVVAVLLVAVLGGGAFFLLSKSSGNNPDASKVAEQSSKSASAQTKDMSTLQSLSFVTPADMGAFTPKSTVGGKQAYVTKDSTDARTCALSFGVYAASELPGADINEILKPQLDRLKSNGITIGGPTAGTPLVVKDESGASYSMPSLTFDVTKGSQHETDHYSIAVLGSGERAVVVRSCANKNGAVDAAAFNVLEDTAQKLTIKLK